MGDDPNELGNARRWITREIDNSLRRLGTDWIDLYRIHRPEEDTDIDETLGGLTDLVHAGKVRYIGSSTFPASQIVEAQWAAERRGRPSVGRGRGGGGNEPDRDVAGLRPDPSGGDGGDHRAAYDGATRVTALGRRGDAQPGGARPDRRDRPPGNQPESGRWRVAKPGARPGRASPLSAQPFEIWTICATLLSDRTFILRTA